MGKYYKKNPETGEHDIPCTWVENLKLTAENSWIPQWRREEVLKIADTLTEEKAEEECKELDRIIRSAIEYWRSYQ